MHQQSERPVGHAHSDPAFLKNRPTLRPSISSVSLSSVIPTPVSHHALRTAAWISLAALVAVAIGFFRSKKAALEFVAAYIVEYSLSVDNLFVFLLIFKYFRVPRDAQESVLTYGIIGAMVLRGVMIVAGKALVNRFEWVALIFAALLIYSAGKLLLEDDDDEADLDDNRVIRFSKALFPVADRYVSDRFFVRENSRLYATPLMVVLVSVELSDVVFALDSVPAVLGISSDTVVIYTSNILAIMGLRSLFFVLSASIGNLRFLNKALAFVLAFIGVKMIAGCFGKDFGIVFSLVVVAVALSAGVILSLLFPGTQSRSSGPDVNNNIAANSV